MDHQAWANIFKTTSNKMTNDRALEMFQTGQGADFVIEVAPQIDGQEKKEFNVHKYVLMLNADVFMEMFSHENTEEPREGRIYISDSTETVVNHMLIYMYTGELPEEYSIETDAGPLMHLANKYQIKSLAQLIELGLVNSLSLTNVLDRLELADLYQTKSLNSACGQLIQSNLKVVKQDAKWLELKKKSPELAFAILEDVDEFGNGNMFKTTSKKMTKDRALEMFKNGQGADCVIEVAPQIDEQDPEKEEFKVHKYVLILNSDVFQVMFSHENTQEAREGRIVIKDSTGTAVRQMLMYMYTGELPKDYVLETDAGPLMHLANKYQIKSLAQLIEQELVHSLSLANVLDRMEMANLYQDQVKSLYSSCGQLIQPNLKMLKNEDKWLELKKNAPELAFSILEEFVDESGNKNDVKKCQRCVARDSANYDAPTTSRPTCYKCGEYGHVKRTCPYNAWHPHNGAW